MLSILPTYSWRASKPSESLLPPCLTWGHRGVLAGHKQACGPRLLLPLSGAKTNVRVNVPWHTLPNVTYFRWVQKSESQWEQPCAVRQLRGQSQFKEAGATQKFKVPSLRPSPSPSWSYGVLLQLYWALQEMWPFQLLPTHSEKVALQVWSLSCFGKDLQPLCWPFQGEWTKFHQGASFRLWFYCAVHGNLTCIFHWLGSSWSTIFTGKQP